MEPSTPWPDVPSAPLRVSTMGASWLPRCGRQQRWQESSLCEGLSLASSPVVCVSDGTFRGNEHRKSSYTTALSPSGTCRTCPGADV